MGFFFFKGSNHLFICSKIGFCESVMETEVRKTDADLWDKEYYFTAVQRRDAEWI